LSDFIVIFELQTTGVCKPLATWRQHGAKLAVQGKTALGKDTCLIKMFFALKLPALDWQAVCSV